VVYLPYESTGIRYLIRLSSITVPAEIEEVLCFTDTGAFLKNSWSKCGNGWLNVGDLRLGLRFVGSRSSGVK
jgi:hypothetical protein